MSSEFHNPELSPTAKTLYNVVYKYLSEMGYDVGVRMGTDVWGPSPLSSSLLISNLANGRYYSLVFWDGITWKVGVYHSDDETSTNGVIFNIVEPGEIDVYQLVEFLNVVFSYLDGRIP